MAPAFRFRDEIHELPAYVPGQRPTVGSAAFKLSSNENPYPPLPSVLAAVADAAADLNRYPSIHGEEFVEQLAGHLGTTADRVVIGNGSVDLLETVISAACRANDEVVFAWRSFEAYPIAVQATGAKAVPVPLTEDGRHDLPAMARAITGRTRVVLLCSPNNPTGPALHTREVLDFLAELPREVLVVLDEAYAHFVTDPDAVEGIDLASRFKNVLVLRSFSKAYGLAGLRLGYAVARPRLIRALRAVVTPFGVNALAQVAASVSLRSQEELDQRVSHLVAERQRVRQALLDQGWEVPDAQGNFVWLPLKERATAFAQQAAIGGVLVRAFDGEGVRVSIGEREANDLFVEVAGAWIAGDARL